MQHRSELTRKVASAYRRYVLGEPWAVLTALVLVLAFFAYHTPKFQLDASADSILIEGDKDLELFREVQKRYRTRDLLVVTFTPTDNLFSDASLERLKALREELRALEGVDSVTTILDVPLLKSAGITLTSIGRELVTLETPGIDRERAKEELAQSHLFKNLLLSDDATTTAVLVNLETDERFRSLFDERNELLARKHAGTLDGDGRARLQQVLAAYEESRRELNERRHHDVEEIRSVIGAYEPFGAVHLGGVPMITDDMIAFIRSDLVVFGAGVLVFLVAVLALIFRQARWVILPLLSCFYAAVVMIGMLGLVGWKVTVISSNFLALMLIITISMNIHLAVRYRQLRRDFPDLAHVDIVDLTTRRMVWPCLYTALTTIMGFSSLVFSEIKPVIDFGWMMSIGLAVTFLTTFSLFPTMLVLLGSIESKQWKGRKLGLTDAFATLTERHGNAVLAGAVILAVVSGIGISRLTVENSFISYFGEDTEIYRGMKLIDQELGGTTPLEVLLDLDENRIFGEEDDVKTADANGKNLEEEEDLDSYESEYADAAGYWFTFFKIDRIKQVHDYLESLPEVGKVLSLASAIRVGEELNDGHELDSLQLALFYKRLPERLKKSLIDPYVSIENNEARIFLRVLDSNENLRRKELLDRIRHDLGNQLELSQEDVTVTGLLVLYNNMLQSLYSSQISTLGVVLLGVAIMFLVLFRSVALSIIGMLPNMLAAAAVLGIMGLLDIPLDMMTITVAAITIGIAVDNSIHYIYRFREEFANSGSYAETLHACHSTIGNAIVYTSLTIIFGFSILVLSNFNPTIHFGLLTGVAMLIALLAALTLLPKLILLWKPFVRT